MATATLHEPIDLASAGGFDTEPVSARPRDRPDRDRLRTLAAMCTVVPLFLHVNGASISLGQTELEWLRTPGVTVAANSLLVASLSAAIVVFGRSLPRLNRKVTAMLFLFAGIQVVAFLFGRVTTIDVSSSNIGALFLVQTLLPIGSFVLWFKLGRVDLARAVDRLGNVGVGVLSIVCLGLLVNTARLGLHAHTGYQDQIGLLVISKSTRFFPSVVAVFASWAVVSIWTARGRSSRLRRAFLLVAAAPLFGVILIAHSRTALLTAVGLSAWSILRTVSTRARPGLGATAALLGAAVIAFAAAGGFGQSEALRSTERLLSPGAEAEYNQGRIRDIAIGLTDGFTQPFGNSYLAEEALVVEDGSRRDIQRVATSENMFGELAARAGPFGLAAFLWILVTALTRSFRWSRSQVVRGSAQAWLPAAVVIVVVFGGITQLNSTEFYIAPVTWALLGLASSAGVPSRSPEPGESF